ncbi:MAG: phosphoribosylamine--glycine ligase [Chitinispirillaceae bacterium]|nr:phosphoribosylamine--glycine ligase [Chitinispirillaceae bacterium]
MEECMNSVLIVGSGGREHALLKAFLRSDRPLCMFAYPGNPGMERDGCMLADTPIGSWEELADWAVENRIDLTVIGPEAPLVDGIADLFNERGLTVFGPSREAAAIEGSKAFSKELMKKYGIPTADFSIFSQKSDAWEYIKKKGAPVVVKASGLAGGKGATVCDTLPEAENALSAIFDKNAFGEAGNTVIIEEKMSGEEISVFVVTDGRSYRILPVSQDHKAVGDGDTGPNTGGMGAYAPAPVATAELMQQVEREIIAPTLNAMETEGRRYRGLLYCGLMVTPQGPKVVEFNCRFGDPETQAVLPLVTGDWFELFRSAAAGKLSATQWKLYPGFGVAVVLASKGYPKGYEKGMVINGLDEAEHALGNLDIYHSGTAVDEQGRIVANGGRVLAVSAWAETLSDAIAYAYEGAAAISFDNMFFRRDIGAKGLARLNGRESSCRRTLKKQRAATPPNAK